MTRARGVFALWMAFATAGLAAVLAAFLAATTRVDYALPALSELAAACRRWTLPHADVATLLVLAVGALATAAMVLSLRAAARQLRATRDFERRLVLRGRLRGATEVRIVDDPTPDAFCAGWLRPRIYVSSGALTLLSDAERDAVLAHEAHHARRRDPLRLLVARSLGEGLFFLPAVGRLAERYAALAELAADEAAERAAGGPKALASALLAFGRHPHSAVVGIAPERVDRLLGERSRAELPMLLMAAAAVSLSGVGAAVARLLQATDHGSISLPQVLAGACMVGMALLPMLLGAAGLLGARRVVSR